MYTEASIPSLRKLCAGMKVTKAQAQENRAHIVETASTLFRERGYDGVGVADLMAAAGFTHGGFYKHFDSKADLMAEAAAFGLKQTAAKTGGLSPVDYVKQYLSREHRDSPGDGCTMAALSGDAARQPASVKATFSDGIENLLSTLAENDASLDPGARRAARERRISVIAQLAGALVLSRACADDSPLADEILDVCRSAILSRMPAPKED